MNIALSLAFIFGVFSIALKLSGSISLQQAAWGLACGLVLLPFYIVKWMGAGDVKFFAILGFLLSPGPLLPIWVVASLLAGLHAAAVIGGAKVFQFTPIVLRTAITSSHVQLERNSLYKKIIAARGGRQGIPYAAYLAFATLLWLFQEYLRG